MVLLFITLQAQVAKLLSVYRYHFPSTTIINANPTLRIYWSGVSILEAGLDCMEQLLKADHSWKYFFNSIGTALPGRPVQVKLYQRVNLPFLHILLDGSKLHKPYQAQTSTLDFFTFLPF